MRNHERTLLKILVAAVSTVECGCSSSDPTQTEFQCGPGTSRVGSRCVAQNGGSAGSPGAVGTSNVASGGTAHLTSSGGDGGTSGAAGAVGAAGAGGHTDVCEVAKPLRCGDRLAHSTTFQGQPNHWQGYTCTQRWEGGRETVYRFSSEEDCTVDVRLVGLTTDLDLLLAECDPGACDDCASYLTYDAPFANASVCPSIPLDLQDDFAEAIRFDAIAGQGRAVLVDGYDGSEGAYTIEVDCACR